MIKMDEAYAWLNVDDVSHLSASNSISILQIEDKRIPEDYRKSVVRELRRVCESSTNILETLEVKLALAKYSFNEGDLASSKFDLQDAVSRYRPGTHRLGVSKWMLGILLWRLNENAAAYADWTKSKELFVSLAQQKVRTHDINMVNWYYQRLRSMRLDLVTRAEEAYYWLNIFEQSHLSPTGTDYVKEIRKKIQAKDYPLAYEIGLQLARISQTRTDTLETAEAWVMVGLSAIQMGNPRLAADYLQRGASAYNPWGHHQAVTRWMLGIAQGMVPDLVTQAVKNWMKAIDAFDSLKLKADRDNDQARKDWYESNIEIMKSALNSRLNGS